MNPIPEPRAPVEADFDEYDDDDDLTDTLPVRPRRPFLTPWTAALVAIVLGALGFYIGVRVEKAKFPSNSAAGGGGGALARAFSGLGGSTGGGDGGTSSSRSGARGLGGRLSANGLSGAAFGGLHANATIGSVSSIGGSILYVTNSSGDLVKVKLGRSTTIDKNESVGRSKIFPGDEVVITGNKSVSGTVQATQVTDSGVGITGAGRSSSTSTSTSPSGSGGSGVGSLFGS